MEKIRYDTYCGLYCGACDIMQAYQKELKTGTPAQWDEMPEEFQQHIPQGTIACRGCKTDMVFIGCSKCPIRKCARKQIGIESCLDCRKYPCLLHKITNLVKKFRKMKQKLPHCKIVSKNLETIRQKGMQTWLEEQEEVWKCPDCGTDFSWYQKTCAQCGKELEELKDYNMLP